MSLDGNSHGIRSPSSVDLRPVNYLPLPEPPAHPASRLRHDAPDHPAAPDPHGRVRLVVRPEAAAGPARPRVRGRVWDITNRQDWAACESVHRGRSSRTPNPARLPRRGRGLLLGHHGRPGLPGRAPCVQARGCARSLSGALDLVGRGERARGHVICGGARRYRGRRVSIRDIPVKTLSGEESQADASPSPCSDLAGKALLVRQCRLEVRVDPAVRDARGAAGAVRHRGLLRGRLPVQPVRRAGARTPDEIATFCSTTYGVTFPMFEKIEVNGGAVTPSTTSSRRGRRRGPGRRHPVELREVPRLALGRRRGPLPPAGAADAPEVIEAIEANLPGGALPRLGVDARRTRGLWGACGNGLALPASVVTGAYRSQ